MLPPSCAPPTLQAAPSRYLPSEFITVSCGLQALLASGMLKRGEAQVQVRAWVGVWVTGLLLSGGVGVSSTSYWSLYLLADLSGHATFVSFSSSAAHG